MKILPAALTGWLLVLPALAVAQDVKIDYDKGFNFSPVKTYSIKLGTAWGNDLSQRRVLTEFDEAIAAKGWKKVAEDPGGSSSHPPRRDPDQAHRQHVLHRHGRRLRRLPLRRHGLGLPTVVSEYTVGMLVVDMFEPKTKTLVFRGTAEDEISDNPEKNAKRLEKAATKMFKEFPPPAKK